MPTEMTVDDDGRVFFPCFGCGSEVIAWECQGGDDYWHVFAFCKSCLARLDAVPEEFPDAARDKRVIAVVA
jgi:hypothetical protein